MLAEVLDSELSLFSQATRNLHLVLLTAYSKHNDKKLSTMPTITRKQLYLGICDILTKIKANQTTIYRKML